MSIASIVTRGFGSFGSPSDIVTLGFSIGEFVAPVVTPGAATAVSDVKFRARKERNRKRRDEDDQSDDDDRISALSWGAQPAGGTERALPAAPAISPAVPPRFGEVPEVLARAVARKRRAPDATQPAPDATVVPEYAPSAPSDAILPGADATPPVQDAIADASPDPAEVAAELLRMKTIRRRREEEALLMLLV